MTLYYFKWNTDDGISLDWMIRSRAQEDYKYATERYIKHINEWFGGSDEDERYVLTEFTPKKVEDGQPYFYVIPNEFHVPEGPVPWESIPYTYFRMELVT